MLGKKFMQAYVSFIVMIMTGAIVGPAYYFLTKYLATFVNEDYRQTVAVVLGVVATAIAYQMMAVIEDAKKMANNFFKSDLD